MKNIVNISELKEGKTIQGFFLCVEKNLETSFNLGRRKTEIAKITKIDELTM